MQRADLELLLNSIGGLGESGFRNRQAQFQNAQSMQRLALESQLRDIQEKRYQAQQSHFNTMEEANNRRADAEEDRLKNSAKQPKIQAYLKDSTGGSMTFQGTYDQLKQMQSDYEDKHPDGELTVSAEPPPSVAKHEVGRTTVGGATHIFYDQNAYDSFLNGLKEHGISPDTKPASAAGDDVSDVEIKHDAVSGSPEVAASEGLFGIGAHPARPAVPAAPAFTEHVKRHKPAGTLAPLNSLSELTNPAPAPAQPALGVPATPNTGASPFSNPQPLNQDALNSLLTPPTDGGSPSAPSPAALGVTMPTPATPNTPAAPVKPPQAHIAFLKQNANNPKVIQDFDQKYGQGSAEQFLNSP